MPSEVMLPTVEGVAILGGLFGGSNDSSVKFGGNGNAGLAVGESTAVSVEDSVIGVSLELSGVGNILSAHCYKLLIPAGEGVTDLGGRRSNGDLTELSGNDSLNAVNYEDSVVAVGGPLSGKGDVLSGHGGEGVSNAVLIPACEGVTGLGGSCGSSN